MSLRAGGGSTRKKVLAVSFLKRSPRSYTFLQSLFPLPSRRSLQSLLNTFQLGLALTPMCLVYSRTMYRQCLIKTARVVSCLTRCQSDSICISIRRLTVLKAMRTLEDTAGQAISQVMPWSSCSMVYVKGGSNQLHTS